MAKLIPEMQKTVDAIMSQIRANAFKSFQQVEFEILLCRFMAASGLPKESLIEFVQSHTVDYIDTCNFFILFGRFPTVNECGLIRSIGLGNFQALVTGGVNTGL